MVPIVRRSTHAMSCDGSIVVVADDPGPLLDHAERRLQQLERRWSRFRDDSEISGLNRAAGAARRCSPDTVALVRSAVHAWSATDGAFDPTLLGALVGLGYGSSRTDPRHRTSLDADVAWRGRPDLVTVDAASGVITLPRGTAIDPGGIGKGLAADLVIAELLDLGADGALVEVGGDLRVGGRPPVGDHWLVEVVPTADEAAVRVALVDGGVATSTTRLRRWTAADDRHREHHHLLDPTSGQPTTGEVVSCTVVAGTAAWAEAFTKMPFVRGAPEACRELTRRGLAARITTDDGTVHHTAAWEDFAR